MFCVHIKYIAQFCEIITVLAGLRLTTYVRVVGITANTYYVLDWDARVWLVLEGGNGYPTMNVFSTQVFQKITKYLIRISYCVLSLYVTCFNSIFKYYSYTCKIKIKI